MNATKERSPNTRFLFMLGLPSLGLAFAVSMLSAYLPSVIHSFASPVKIGLIVGAEGFFGIFAPVIFGNLADRVKNVGDRLRYLWPSTLLMVVGLVLMAQTKQLYFIGIMVAIFYIGYYGYLAPYWALYPDLIPDRFSGRSRSAEGVWRVIGSLAALISGGFLISLWQPLPFVLAAGLIVVVTLLLKPVLSYRMKRPLQKSSTSVKESFAEMLETLRKNPSIRNLFIANALWNATLRSILAFTVLFFTVGLGRSHHFVAGIIFPVAAIGIAIMAPLAGKLADKFGHKKIIIIATLVYGIGDLVPGVTQHEWVVFLIPLVSAAAATIMVLPYSMLMNLISDEAHGAVSGLFGVSRGLGSFLGPIATGSVVVAGRHTLSSTHGYAAFWLASGVYVLVSLFFFLQIPTR